MVPQAAFSACVGKEEASKRTLWSAKIQETFMHADMQN